MMTWTKQIPTEAGWYWKRNPSDEYDEPECVHVRDYAGELAIGNAYLRGWDGLKRYEWAGPIPMPNASAQGSAGYPAASGSAINREKAQ